MQAGKIRAPSRRSIRSRTGLIISDAQRDLQHWTANDGIWLSAPLVLPVGTFVRPI